MNIENYNFKQLPKVYYNGVEYHGEGVFVNGFNGYTKTKGDSMLCAIFNKSAFNELKEPNYLKDENDNFIHSENRRGLIFNF